MGSAKTSKRMEVTIFGVRAGKTKRIAAGTSLNINQLTIGGMT